MRTIMRLFLADWRNGWRSYTIPAAIFALVLLYSVSFGMNVGNYRAGAERLRKDGAEGFFFRVPLEEPIKNYGYFSSFAPAAFPSIGQRDSRVGLLLLPDRYEEAGSSTRSGRWNYLIMASIVLLFAYREGPEIRRKRLLPNLLTSPLQIRHVFLAKMMMGIVLALSVFLCDTLMVGVISFLCDLNLSWPQYLQILLYNGCMGLMIATLYGLTLSATAGVRDGEVALLRIVLILVAVVFILPAVLESFRDLIYSQLPRDWRTEWYWHSRYLQGFDLFSSYSELTSDLLYPGRARIFYSSLPWTRALTGSGPFTMGRLLKIQWFRCLTLGMWAILAYIVAERRFRKTDVA